MDPERYNFKVVEEKWQNYWLENKTFKAEIIEGKKKFYCLEMFPYPIWQNSYGSCKKLYYW